MTNLALAATIRRAIAAPGPAWLPGLARALADDRWTRIPVETGLSAGTYGLDRFVSRDAGRARPELTRVNFDPPVFGRSTPLIVELPGAARERYEELGLEFFEVGAVEPANVKARLGEALRIIALVPDLAVSVGAVLWTIQILRPPGPEYDVSHSDPEVPFTVFVSIAAEPEKMGALRLAEAIVHESMHLQLTLIEEVIPLLQSADATLYSPWRREQRPLQGVLHGLYVFRVIADLIDGLLATSSLPPTECEYIIARRAEILEEVAEIRELKDARELTADGRALVERLLPPLGANSLH